LQYAELNSGLEHHLFEKYPRLLSIVMIGMMYGFGLPIFLILTLICLIVSYIVDKILVAYYYRKPHLYDDVLNMHSLSILKWGAFVYIAVGYWMVSNRQMFGNSLNPIAYHDQIQNTDHNIYQHNDYKFQSILKWTAIALGLCFFIYDFCYGWITLCFISSPKIELKNLETLVDFPE